MFFPIGTPVCRRLRQYPVIFESDRSLVNYKSRDESDDFNKKSSQVLERLEGVSIASETQNRPTPVAFPRNS